MITISASAQAWAVNVCENASEDQVRALIQHLHEHEPRLVGEAYGLFCGDEVEAAVLDADACVEGAFLCRGDAARAVRDARNAKIAKDAVAAQEHAGVARRTAARAEAFARNAEDLLAAVGSRTGIGEAELKALSARADHALSLADEARAAAREAEVHAAESYAQAG
ncbi:hypothetical protein GCM10011374_37190 [Kocuria dechangensis]|uniref:Uncharacterized protein n=1 Tax=Kocuria dechangensis TaxID=1176249 RepID=A0A917M0T8_9MICC|nr:hypothetical protein [Kocuria dechangensis]GGG69355.1 hypothetical protein GCM10011374_37190 [Kocuria dechangensis]